MKIEKAGVLVITSVALAGIGLLTTALLSHLSVIQGINTASQLTWVGTGTGCVLASLSATAVFFCCLRRTADELGKLTLEELEEKIEAILESDEDVVTAMSKLVGNVPLETLEQLVRERHSTFQGGAATADKLASQAALYLGMREQFSLPLQARLGQAFDVLVNLLDSIFLALGIADFFEQPESKLEGDFKFQKIMMLISLFTLLTSTLLPLLGVTTGASIVGGTLLSIAILSVIWPHIRPSPKRLPEAENWSQQQRDGKLGDPQGRKEKLDLMARTLENGKKHPLLIGQSGVGKTQTVKAFVQAVERGDYPALKGKAVFYFNTADLATNQEMFGGGNRILKRISDAMGRHRDNCILVLDEIHMAYQNDSPLGEQLKTKLDRKPNNFPHVIGLTTEEEYSKNIYAGNAAGDRRFKKITIGSTDALATRKILAQTLIDEAPDAVIEKGALEYLVERTNKQTQPLTAVSHLAISLAKTSNLSESATMRALEEEYNKLHCAFFEGMVHGATGLESEGVDFEKFAALERSLQELVPQVEAEQEALDRLGRMRENLVKVRDAKFRYTLENSKLKEFIVLRYFVEKILEEKVAAASGAVNFKTVVTKDLIDQVIEEEAENARLRQEALERAQTDIDSRKSD